MDKLEELLKKIGCHEIQNDAEIAIDNDNDRVKFDLIGFINDEPVVGIDVKTNKGIGVLSKLSTSSKIQYYGIIGENENSSKEWYQLIGGNISQLKKEPSLKKDEESEVKQIEKWINRIIEQIHINESVSLVEILIETAKIILVKIIIDQKKNTSEKKITVNFIKFVFEHFIKEHDDIGSIILRESTIDKIIHLFSNISLSNIDRNNILKAYDQVIIDNRNKSQGEFIIPEILPKLSVKIFKGYIKQASTFFDGSSGIGQFLTMVKKYNPELDVFGMEYNQRIVKIAKLRSLIVDQNNSIINDDSINTKKHLNSYIPDNIDLIISSPIFGRKINDRAVLDEYNFAGKNRKSEDIYLELYINLLKPGGYLGYIVPDGLLVTSRDKYIREYILKETILKAVISLPQGIYRPYTAIRTSFLILKKKEAANDKQQNVFMASPESVEDLEKVVDELIEWEELF